jgi:hypothetical protein
MKKALIDRRKFIEWVLKNHPDKLLPPLKEIADDLALGSEFITDADIVLRRFVHIPAYFAENWYELDYLSADDVVVAKIAPAEIFTKDCKLIFIPQG